MALSEKLATRAADTAVIKAPALNISLGSIGVIALGTALTWWKEAFEFLFGASASPGLREAVLIASIAAFVLVVSADMIARAIATHYDVTHIVPWGKGWEATWIKPGADERGFVVAGMRVSASNPDAVEYLLVKDGAAPTWRPAKEVQLEPPPEKKAQ